MNRLLNVGCSRVLKVNGEEFAVTERVYIDFDMAAECVGYYVPDSVAVPEICRVLMDSIQDLALSYRHSVSVELRHPHEGGTSSSGVLFTGRVYFYTENELPPKDIAEVEEYARGKKLLVVIRGPSFAHKMSSLEKPVAFICHDSRDKAEIAGPIALELEKRMCRVWYDEYSFNVGDNLRERIEKGLRECRKVITIISPHFLTNRGWTKTEFESVFSRELIETRNVILPVWVGVTRQEVYQYSPMLVNRFAVKWDASMSFSPMPAGRCWPRSAA